MVAAVRQSYAAYKAALGARQRRQRNQTAEQQKMRENGKCISNLEQQKKTEAGQIEIKVAEIDSLQI